MKRGPLTRAQSKTMTSKNDYKKLKNEENIEFENVSRKKTSADEDADDESLHGKTLNRMKPKADDAKSNSEVDYDKSDEDAADDDDKDNEDDDKELIDPKSKKTSQQNVKKDLNNIALLMFLYFLQGIPLGLTGSLPYILSSRKVSYADQGTFSFAFWPFSLKLLWAPIVDSLFIQKIGRRKSWLVPVQYMIGLFMIMFANYTKNLLEGTGSNHDIYVLTAIFFMFTFLAATQDIVVDGWALTMLSKENVSWGSTCNTVGQTAGWFVGNVLFLTIESADFSNKYLRPLFSLPDQTYGLVTIDKFMFYFGIIFIISTTLVFLFKKEVDNSEENSPKSKSFEDSLTVKQTYKLMWNLLWLAPIKKIILILMTVKISFAAESMSYLKLIEAGVPKEKLALLSVPLTPLQILLPLLISRYTNGPYPFNFFIKSIPYRLVAGIVVMLWVYATPFFKDSNNDYPFYYYILCFFISVLHSIFVYAMFVSQMAFFSRISDKKIGGTYMTFLNTISNMGGNWPSTSALYLASVITIKACALVQTVNVSSVNSTILNMTNATLNELINKNSCSNDTETNDCTKLGGNCETKLNAFYLETVVCTIFGIFWILVFRKVMYNLQSLPKKSWKLSKLN